MSTEQLIRMGQSNSIDPIQAVAEFKSAVMQSEIAGILFFCSSSFDLGAIAREMNAAFPDVLVVGCTTAGEIGPQGCVKNTLSGLSFSSEGFTLDVATIDGLQNFTPVQGRTLVNNLMQNLEPKVPLTPNDTFAFLLVDGLSLREEQLAHTLQEALGEFKLFGGSAADDLAFSKTWIFSEGTFQPDRAALVLVNTIYSFKLFKTQHFVSGDEKLVVTRADPKQRIVYEINGYPAVEEYARIVNCPANKLDPEQFSATPFVIRINGMDYVRSIQKANPDGSLKFYCAIDNGLIFMAARGIDLVKNLQQTFADIESEIGKPQVVLVCDCVLRNLEIQRKGIKAEVEKLFKEHNVVGFNTYGEQFRGIHINQTITGLAIGTTRNRTYVR